MRKIMLAIVIFTLFFVVETFAWKRNFQDTVKVQMPNNTTLEMAMFYRRENNYWFFHSRLKSVSGLKSDLDNFLKRWEVMGIEDLEKRNPLLIEQLDDKIKVEEREKQKIQVLFPKETKRALSVNGKHKLILHREYCDVFIYFDKIAQIEELEEYDLKKIFEQGDEEMKPIAENKKKRKVPVEAWLSVEKDNTVGLSYSKFAKQVRNGYNKYQIELFFAPGISCINGKWASSFASVLMFSSQNENGHINKGVGVGYEVMYNQVNAKANISQWVDVVLGFGGVSRKGLQGVNIGFLVKEKGDFFTENNKYRLGFHIGITDQISIVPEVYYRKLFKRAKSSDRYYGVKIRFRL